MSLYHACLESNETAVGEYLEWIVIWLIAMEILVAVITTSLDAFSLYYNKES